MATTAQYAIVIEPTAGFSTYAPDLPGCVSVGETYDEAVAMMREAIALHLDGESLPAPTSEAVSGTENTNGYDVILEKSATGFGAYCPSIYGCVAVGDTREETIQLYAEALSGHFECMREDGEPISPPTTRVTMVTVPAP